MTVSEVTLTTMGKTIKYLKRVPSGTFFYFDYQGGLRLEANTLNEVRTIRACFPGVIWKKQYEEYGGQWRYSGRTRNGVDVTITGVKEAPAQCKMVEETVMEERKVPVTYETRMVEVKKIKYICPDGDKVAKTA